MLWLRGGYILEYVYYCGEYVVAVVAGRHSAHNMGMVEAHLAMGFTAHMAAGPGCFRQFCPN